MKMFLGIPLNEDACEEIEIISTGIRGARWIPRDNLHLTLQFLGDLIPTKVQELQQSLGRFFFRPFQLELKGIGHFPPKGEVHTLWVGVTPNESLLQLKNKLDQELSKLQIHYDKRKFIPHITIARLKGCDNREIGEFIIRNNLFKYENMPVNEFNLYSSHSQNPFPQYRIESNIPLTRVNS